MRTFSIYMRGKKWTYPRSGSCGSAIGFWKSDLFHENPKIVINFETLIAGPFWPSKHSNLDILVKCIVVLYHVSCPTQFESTQSDNWVKSYGQNTEQCTGWNSNPNWALDNSEFFHLWSTSSGFRSPYLVEFDISWF